MVAHITYNVNRFIIKNYPRPRVSLFCLRRPRSFRRGRRPRRPATAPRCHSEGTLRLWRSAPSVIPTPVTDVTGVGIRPRRPTLSFRGAQATWESVLPPFPSSNPPKPPPFHLSKREKTAKSRGQPGKRCYNQPIRRSTPACAFYCSPQ